MTIVRGVVAGFLVLAARIALRALYGAGWDDWAAVVEDN